MDMRNGQNSENIAVHCHVLIAKPLPVGVNFNNKVIIISTFVWCLFPGSARLKAFYI